MSDYKQSDTVLFPVDSNGKRIYHWTDSATQVVAPVALGRGEVERGTADLSEAVGAYLFLGVGRGGTTALGSAINIEVRRTLNDGGLLMPGIPFYADTTGTTAAYAKQINYESGYAAGTAAFTVDGTGTPASDEDLCFWGKTAVQVDGTSLPNLEFLRVSKYAANVVTVDSACKVAKINNELFTNQASMFYIWCPGGCTYEVIFDYGAAATGEAVAVVCYSQTLDH